MVAARDWADAAGLSGHGEQRQYGPCERLRRGRGWSQVKLAGRADVNVATVARLESGKIGGLRSEMLIRISMALGCAVVDLVPGFAVRIGKAGGEVVERPKRKGRARWTEPQRERVRGMLVEVLRRAGGRMAACEVAKEFERYQLSRGYLAARRRELGIESVRRMGWGNGPDRWDWVLPAALQATAAESAPAAH
jgi:transcriptional regulator with XRE-family HTH domain